MKAQVLLPKIFNFSFTYKTKKEKLTPGEIVEVPFGKENEVGVVWDEPEQTNKEFKLREINEKLPDTLNVNFVKFINWFSLYNLAPKGMVLKMCLGNKTNIIANENNKDEKISNKKKYTLNSEQKQSLEDLKSFGENFND